MANHLLTDITYSVADAPTAGIVYFSIMYANHMKAYGKSGRSFSRENSIY